MTHAQAVKIAVKAMRKKKQRHAIGHHAFVMGHLKNDGDHKEYIRLDEAIEVLIASPVLGGRKGAK